MFRPGGYSSEESDDDLGEFDMYFEKTHYEPKENKEKVLTEAERREIMLSDLAQCAFGGKTEMVLKYLDEEDINVDFMLKENWTLLMIAASMGNDELALEMIKRGANVNQSRDEYTVLMAACTCPVSTSPYEKSFKIVEELVKKKADVNAKSRKRMTPLMCAASSGNLYAVDLLLPICNKNDEDNQGWTALFWAVNDNHADVLSLLLENGLNYNKYDIRRLKPLDYAKQGGHTNILNILPDPDGHRDCGVSIISHYIFSEEVMQKKFQRDVYVMLLGMRCFNLLKIFCDMDMDLYTFLTLTKEDLNKLGIIKPYQQNRILGGIFRFHKHPFKLKSIPVVSQNEIYTSIDVGRSIISALRHIITMQASIKYLYLNINDVEDPTELLKHINAIEDKIEALEHTINLLRMRTKEWDIENTPVDLITAKWMPRSNWMRLFTFASTTVLSIIFIKIKFC